ncbi:hypothetical protein BDY17DRAFT_325093 [Neohortaea acidophila]|uniref:Uncharacterized protein n=1 Tax=Neohortaea acidophila TaxID=245834 RepID=A0A6A6PS85_9PEZI|nr:uncharacterized protein BDY17DRAFT_325093 [Neohortaea acidophila]KAF2482842.1 hypothetical protein BDY17DRAFT_325093 [Neohortaea acidophila]
MSSSLSLEKLVVQPPITANSIKNFDQSTVARDAEETRIIVHARFPELAGRFLEHKRARGSQHEKSLYATDKTFTWKDLVTRLIEKRPLVFMNGTDHTMLRDGTKPKGRTTTEWDRNGTDEQHLNKYLTLEKYLSYDEIMLGSLIGVSSPSYFINDGNRYNQGQEGKAGTFQPRGVIIGLVGARFERDDRMDSVYMLAKADNPHQDPRLTGIFEDFFGAKRHPEADFDSGMYKGRIRITVDMLLLEADARAKQAAKTAYTYVVGLGLGVWQYHNKQAEYYIDTFATAIEELRLPNTSTIEFAWITAPKACQSRVSRAAEKKDIKVIFSKRNPAEKLANDEELLVLSYAWDGNAFPGNEYWEGSLTASGDPAAACMSTIGELHNPVVNPFTKRITVLGR